MRVDKRIEMNDAISTAKKYLTANSYKIIDSDYLVGPVHIVAMAPDDVLAFIRIETTVGGNPSELNMLPLRSELEDYVTKWICKHTEHLNTKVRFDCISFQVNNDGTGLLRHHIDVINPDPDVLATELKAARETIRTLLATIESLTANSAIPDTGTLEAELKAARETIKAMAANNDAMQQHINALKAELAFKAA